MTQTESEYNKDNGYRSRKFILATLGVILLCVLGVIFAVFGLAVGIYSTLATSVVAIILGYSGISAGRSVIPRVAQNKKEQHKNTAQTLDTDSGNKEEL